jgi:hypothetical protein
MSAHACCSLALLPEFEHGATKLSNISYDIFLQLRRRVRGDPATQDRMTRYFVLAMGCSLKAAMGRLDGGLQLFLLLPLVAPRREVSRSR